ncbi:hypothetical protein SETIT_7G296500v2 [Setaria italica]|uniref:Uncharacterized protein n=1 Tax=Setaria italica TaxID=4555 RepID=A0A368S166_SETIT|nr:hypothetical protein SETIT_7G296500v2 [Setaria italica]
MVWPGTLARPAHAHDIFYESEVRSIPAGSSRMHCTDSPNFDDERRKAKGLKPWGIVLSFSSKAGQVEILSALASCTQPHSYRRLKKSANLFLLLDCNRSTCFSCILSTDDQ